MLVVRRSEIRPEETAEPPEILLAQLGEWLADPFERSIVADLCLSGYASGTGPVGTVAELRARLQGAFQIGTLVAVRVGAAGSAARISEAQRTQEVASEVGKIKGRSSSAKPVKTGRGWALSSRSGRAVAVKKSDLRAGEPTDDSGYPISQLDRWVANPAERAALEEMYQAVYGPADASFHSPMVLKQKVGDAFRKGDLLLLLAPVGGSTGGGDEGHGDTKAAQRLADKDAPPAKAAKSTGESTETPKEKPKVEKTWVRFRLLDEDGEPMDDEPYEMVDSNGSKRTGKLDKDGCVYIPPILNPGNCIINFPEIHLNPLKNPKRKRTRKSA